MPGRNGGNLEEVFDGHAQSAYCSLICQLVNDSRTDAYRLVHSEGDDLSGLVVDRFGSALVLEFFAAGMIRLRTMLQDILLPELLAVALVLAHYYVEFSAGINQHGSSVHPLNSFKQRRTSRARAVG